MEAITFLHEHKEFVVGYIAHSPLLLLVVGEEVDMLTFTTGVNSWEGVVRKPRDPVGEAKE